MSNKTFVAIKPGFTEKQNIVDYIENTFKGAGCKIINKTTVQYTFEQAMEHYNQIPEKFQIPAATYLSSGPVIGYILEDNRNDDREIPFIDFVRSVQGNTRCTEGGTIRYVLVNDPRFAEDVADVRAKYMDKEKGIDEITTNIIHASDSPANFIRETEILNRAILNSEQELQ